jgi:hypothetical protein
MPSPAACLHALFLPAEVSAELLSPHYVDRQASPRSTTSRRKLGKLVCAIGRENGSTALKDDHQDRMCINRCQ